MFKTHPSCALGTVTWEKTAVRGVGSGCARMGLPALGTKGPALATPSPAALVWQDAKKGRGSSYGLNGEKF